MIRSKRGVARCAGQTHLGGKNLTKSCEKKPRFPANKLRRSNREKYELGQYVFVNAADKRIRNHFWIAKVIGVLKRQKYKVQWAYRPIDLPCSVRDNDRFSKWEILMTEGSHEQAILEGATFMGRADVLEQCEDRNGMSGWYWNRYYDDSSGLYCRDERIEQEFHREPSVGWTKE
ncbi:hypothetical protein DM02DRAFT_734376 [Periconia macrospinosa]|uniref:BAH domain-containing protein n=1 Tax=Periconia macrospinosa TaxID=97972 RepID=A0A2V1CZX3_9PLEO|nr:hypothetical protein DM02DRAFT_734376 [Periconia macrospinosa]